MIACSYVTYRTWECALAIVSVGVTFGLTVLTVFFTNTKSNFPNFRGYSSGELMIDSRGTYLPFKHSYLKDTLQVGNNVCVIKQGSLPRLRNAITSWTSHFEQVKRYYSSN